MINEAITIKEEELMEFKPLPENIYEVQLLELTAEARPTYDTRNNPVDQQELETILNFQFVLLEGKDGDQDLRGRSVWANFIPPRLYQSKNGKSKLWRIIEALLSRELTGEERAYMDANFLNNLAGLRCRVGTKNKSKGEKTYTNIETYYPSANTSVSELTPEEKDKATVKPKDDGADKANNEFNRIDRDTQGGNMEVGNMEVVSPF
jgi:hypothetical protein